jgi:hypothetical protein
MRQMQDLVKAADITPSLQQGRRIKSVLNDSENVIKMPGDMNGEKTVMIKSNNFKITYETLEDCVSINNVSSDVNS